jgi:indole-3-glycerol phosphate synthase
MNLLSKILADKAREVAARKKLLPLRELRAMAKNTGRPPSFVKALRARPVGLIAEVKRRSPSVGLIRSPFDPAAIARAYEAGGAQALSVLMDEKYFGGGASDFAAVRAAVKLPLLYKEFVLEPWQVWHARCLGASAVLLIVAALERRKLKSLMALITELDMEPLVEVHDAAECEVAVGVGARCLGVNNRDLRTFTTSLQTTVDLAGRVPRGTLLVSESGIRTAADVVLVKNAGARAVLVGEHLLRQSNLKRAVQNLMGRAWAAS